MITYLELRNWRAFDKATLHLQPGTTFVVAENGIGKTSLLRGAAWTLFADRAVDPSEELRRLNGATETIGVVTMSTPEGELHVERRHKLTKRPRDSVKATLNGTAIDGRYLAHELTRLLGARTDIATQLGFVHQHALLTDRQLFTSIGSYLRRITGVDRLETTRDVVRKVQRSLDRRAVTLGKQVRNVEAGLDELRQRCNSVLAGINEAENELSSLLAQYEESTKVLRDNIAWEEYDIASSDCALESKALETRIAEILDKGELEKSLAQIQADYEAQAERLAGYVATASLHKELGERLAGTDAACPVCLQRISPTQAVTAAEHHHYAVREAKSSAESTRTELEQLRNRVTELQRLQRQRQAIRIPKPPSFDRPRNIEQTRSTHEWLSGQIESVESELATRRIDLGVRERNLSQALADADKSAELVQIRRLEAVATAAIHVLDRSIDHHVANQVGPLTETISRNWGQFFSSDGLLMLNPHGEIELLKDGEKLLYPQLSGGQQMLAILTMRLTLVAATANLGCLWLDEPLEHLDPINRRRAASLLIDASRGSAVRQILATTYEEEIARRLASIHSDVHLEYVRSY